MSELQGVARRLVTCGMHVHIGIEDPDLRIDMMNQIKYFLPHLLAFSTSSPYWDGTDTGLKSFRLSIFDGLPRTGLPEYFDSFAQYERFTKVMTDSGLVEDTSKLCGIFAPMLVFLPWRCGLQTFVLDWMIPLPLPPSMFLWPVGFSGYAVKIKNGGFTQVLLSKRTDGAHKDMDWTRDWSTLDDGRLPIGTR